MPSGADIVSRYGVMRDRRANWDSRVDRMAPYYAPSRLGVVSERQPGTNVTPNVYDSTGIFASDICTKFFCGLLTNPASKWAGFRERRDEIANIDEVKEWLEECRDRMLASFGNSNFYAENYETVRDWVTFGTGSLFCREQDYPKTVPMRGFRGFHFEAQRIGRFVIAEDPMGNVDTHMVEFRMSARNAAAKWGEDKMPESIKSALRKPESVDQLFSFIHAVYPKDGDDRTPLTFASCYIEKETKTKVGEEGFEDFPYMVPTMDKTPGEEYGHGLGEMAFPDVSTLNTLKRLSLEDLALKTRPPIIIANDSTRSPLKLRPAGEFVVKTNGRPVRDVLAPYETGSHPEVSQVIAEDLRKSIRQHFFVDQILMLLEIDKTQMTAYEFHKKLELLNKILGPIFGGWQSKFGIPLINRAFNVMYRAGAFSPPPQAIVENGGVIDPIFDNPLARAQKAGDIEPIQAAMAELMPIVQAEMALTGGKSKITNILDWDKLYREVLDVSGVRATVVRSEEETAKIEQAEIAAAEEQKQMQQVGAVAEAAGKAAPALKLLQPEAKAA